MKTLVKYRIKFYLCSRFQETHPFRATYFGCKYTIKDWISKEMSVKMLNLAQKIEDLCRLFLKKP